MGHSPWPAGYSRRVVSADYIHSYACRTLPRCDRRPGPALKRSVPLPGGLAADGVPDRRCVGSLLNVCILRLPRGRSLLWPGSTCGACFQRIPWRDNIPLVSYWLLRGRCGTCGAGFSSLYFWIELLDGPVLRRPLVLTRSFSMYAPSPPRRPAAVHGLTGWTCF